MADEYAGVIERVSDDEARKTARSSLTARETRTTSIEETSSEDAEKLATDVRDGDVGGKLLRAYNLILSTTKKVLSEPFPDSGDKWEVIAWTQSRKSAQENRRFALTQLQSLLDMALKHTAKRRLTQDSQSATAITREQLAEIETMPAEGRKQLLLALKENKGKIREILKQYGKESTA